MAKYNKRKQMENPLIDTKTMDYGDIYILIESCKRIRITNTIELQLSQKIKKKQLRTLVGYLSNC